jgi:hypothetical protein
MRKLKIQIYLLIFLHTRIDAMHHRVVRMREYAG